MLYADRSRIISSRSRENIILIGYEILGQDITSARFKTKFCIYKQTGKLGLTSLKFNHCSGGFFFNKTRKGS